MDPATALQPAPPQRKATSSAESESSSAHDEDDLSLASGWSDEERASQGDGQPRVNDKSPTIDNDVQDSLLVVSTSATDVETLRLSYPNKTFLSYPILINILQFYLVLLTCYLF